MRRLCWSLALMIGVSGQTGCSSLMRPCGMETPPGVTGKSTWPFSPGDEPGYYFTRKAEPAAQPASTPMAARLLAPVKARFARVLPATNSPQAQISQPDGESGLRLTSFSEEPGATGSSASPDPPVIGAPLEAGPAACDPDRTSVRAEYLYWWQRGTPVPALVTTSPAGTPRADAGVLGEPGTAIVFGGERVGEEARSGGRITLGYWFDDERTLGMEGGFFMLETDPLRFGARSDETGSPILARPFFNDDPAIDAPASELIAYPGVFAGAISASGSSSFLGSDAYVRCELCSACGCCNPCDPQAGWTSRVDLLGGGRYLRLRENLGLREDITSIDPASLIPPGTRFEVEDHFGVKNDFYGAEIGAIAVVGRGPWSLEGTAKLAFGVSRKRVDISGFNRVTAPGEAPLLTEGGLLAQPTNIGQYSDHSFAMVPELGLKLGYQATERLRASVGYSLIWWDHVVRPGDQMDLTVNATQLGGNPTIGPDRPAFEFRDSSYWLQGLSAGLEFRF